LLGLLTLVGLTPVTGLAAPPGGTTSATIAPPNTADEAVTIADCATCPVMTVLRPGSFLMGSLPSDNLSYSWEYPQHKVTINYKLAIGTYLVTFREWDACVAAGGCKKYSPSDEGWGRGARPVINVSWNDAQTYVAWLSKVTKKNYRLPSESEWEYATRAGTTTEYWWGNTLSPHWAHYWGPNGPDKWGNETAPVGKFPHNRFGLYDSAGNVWEWVTDRLHLSYTGAPTDGSAWIKGTTQPYRVMRGGAFNDWSYSLYGLRSACRYSDLPGNRWAIVGFRVARVVTP
jgi:formylglycine-generating enzyme required for sulfatase activity